MYKISIQFVFGVTIAVMITGCGGNGDIDSHDPLYRFQWHLQNTGQHTFSDIKPLAGIDLNIGALYQQGITGKGVVVGIVEPGTIDPLHEDLMANLVLKDGAGAAPQAQAAAHTTAVAGIIAAVADNGKGGRGVAPDAKILDMQAPGAKGQPPPRIINQSEGMPITGFLATPFDDDFMSEMLANPSGPLLIKAAGNNFIENTLFQSIAECATFTRNSGVGCMPITDPLSAMPNTLVVGAVNAMGKKASYSSTGSVLWISGLGGESGYQSSYALLGGPLPEKATRLPDAFFGSAITTTDVMGCDRGVNKDGVTVNALDFGSRSSVDRSCNYTAIANGTSSAAPTVSGVAALMLQVNPALGWRDIKYILATTARKVDPNLRDIVWNNFVIDSGWVMNAAGQMFSNWYGFGLVDATAAVEFARNFQGLPTFEQSQWYSYGGMPVAIPYRREDTGYASLTVDAALKVESVQLRVKTTHRQPGNLRIALISPSGTRSIVMPALTAVQLVEEETFEIGLTVSNAFLNEQAQGIWKLQVVDILDPMSEVASALTSWQISVLGHQTV